ncbi:MAG: hypothetical protein AAB563_02785, partial [Patescibacteria group bacterium]
VVRGHAGSFRYDTFPKNRRISMLGRELRLLVELVRIRPSKGYRPGVPFEDYLSRLLTLLDDLPQTASQATR